jgi:hypothetical protein
LAILFISAPACLLALDKNWILESTVSPRMSAGLLMARNFSRLFAHLEHIEHLGHGLTVFVRCGLDAGNRAIFPSLLDGIHRLDYQELPVCLKDGS